MQAIAQQEPERSSQTERRVRGFAQSATDKSYGTDVCSTRLVSKREHIVAAKREVIERRGVAVPTGSVQFFRANDVSGGTHLHSSLSQRTFDQRDFQLDRGARFEFTRRQEIDSARADVSRYQRDRNWFGHFANSNQAKSQRKASARMGAAFFRYADSVRGNTSKMQWPRFTYGGHRLRWILNFHYTQRRYYRLSVPLRSSPHSFSPKYCPTPPLWNPNMRVVWCDVNSSTGERAV
jgi:hypothetical protein